MHSLRQRKTIRLKGYDYSQNGCYFITICTRDREYLFGDVAHNAILLNEYGTVAESQIQQISSHYVDIEIPCYTVMPNHVHFIVVFMSHNTEQAGAASGAPTIGKRKTIGNVVRGYKSGVSRITGISPWQRNYHDHIIRNEESYQRITAYIENNPLFWTDDCFYQ
jgi:REP element-mobilizing transposase RayT